MISPAYDLRSNARTSGNPDRLPRRWRLPMLLVCAVLAGSLGVFAVTRVIGAILEKRLTVLIARQTATEARVARIDQLLAAPRWRNATLALQPLLVRLLATAPAEVSLSELSFQSDPTVQRYRFRAGINSDRNTAARRFRELLAHLQQREGLQVVSIQQVAASGSVVFEATLAPETAAAPPTKSPGI